MRAWIEIHQEELMADWQLAVEGQSTQFLTELPGTSDVLRKAFRLGVVVISETKSSTAFARRLCRQRAHRAAIRSLQTPARVQLDLRASVNGVRVPSPGRLLVAERTQLKLVL